MFRKTHCSGSTCDDSSAFITWLESKVKGVEMSVGGDLPFVSIVIPTYNRASMLGMTLESFLNLEYPKDRFEIVVADNNSPDNTRQVVDEWAGKSPVRVRYLFEERQGVHYARNSAARVAEGELLYFTDDDMLADPPLLRELIPLFSAYPEIGAATGRVLPRWESPPPDWMLKLCYNGWLSIFDSLGEGVLSCDDDFGVYSCHQAIRREALFRAGGFNPESTITDYIGDGETGLNIKLKALGYKFGYNGKSVIYHMIPRSRMTQDYLNKRLANQGSADCYSEYRKNLFSRDELLKRIGGYRDKILENSFNATIKKMSGDMEWHLDEAYTYYYLNRISYDLRLAHDPEWRELVLKDDWITA